MIFTLYLSSVGPPSYTSTMPLCGILSKKTSFYIIKLIQLHFIISNTTHLLIQATCENFRLLQSHNLFDHEKSLRVNHSININNNNLSNYSIHIGPRHVTLEIHVLVLHCVFHSWWYKFCLNCGCFVLYSSKLWVSQICFIMVSDVRICMIVGYFF